MEKHKLKAEKRKLTGRKIKKLRREGILPANLYGKGIKSLSIQVPVKDFLKVYKEAGETGIIDLSVGEGEVYTALVHNLQAHPVSNKPLHVDFRQVSLTEKITATVPVESVGKPPAVTQKIGLLLTPVTEIQVEALPADLPEKIEVDVSSLKEVGQEIKVKDLKVSEKVTVLAEPELVVAKIGELVTEETKKILEEEKAAAEAAAAEAAAAEAAAEKGEAPAEEAPAEAEAPAEGEKPSEAPAPAKAPAGKEEKPVSPAGGPAPEK